MRVYSRAQASGAYSVCLTNEEAVTCNLPRFVLYKRPNEDACDIYGLRAISLGLRLTLGIPNLKMILAKSALCLSLVSCVLCIALRKYLWWIFRVVNR